MDHDDPATAREVHGRLSAVVDRGATFLVEHTGQQPAAERDIEDRRIRITDAWRWFLENATGEVLFGAEDDTIPDTPDAYTQLLAHLQGGAVFAQGTEVARQAPYIPHWMVSEGLVVSASSDGDRVVPIGGGGWYCCAMLTELARECTLTWDRFPLGPDVQFVWELAQQGRCVGDWGIECSHWAPEFWRHPGISDLVQVRYNHNGVNWIREERSAKPWRRADIMRTEDGNLIVRVKKPFTGSPAERAQYGDPGRNLILPGTVMEISDARFNELGRRKQPIVIPLGAVPVTGADGASATGWCPPVRTPEGALKTAIINPETSPAAKEQPDHWCEVCEKGFKSSLALSGHRRSKAHKNAVAKAKG